MLSVNSSDCVARKGKIIEAILHIIPFNISLLLIRVYIIFQVVPCKYIFLMKKPSLSLSICGCLADASKILISWTQTTCYKLLYKKMFV